MSKYMLLGIIGGVYVLNVMLSLTHFGGSANDQFQNVFLGICQLIAVLSGIYSVRILGIKNPTGKAILFFSLGIFVNFIGSSIFAYNDFTSGQGEFPSMADAIILCAYPLFFIGLLTQLRSGLVQISKSNKLLLTLFSLLLGVVVVYFGVILPFDPAAPFLVNFVQTCYGIVDLILILVFVFVLLLAFDYKGGKLFYPWFYIFIGVLITLLADILFAIFTKEYLAKTSIQTFINLIWCLAYVFYAYGLFKFGVIITEVQKNILLKMEMETKADTKSKPQK